VVSTCPTCDTDFSHHPEFHNCASCGRVVCPECGTRCECGQYFCEDHIEQVDDLELCAECKVVYLHELESAAVRPPYLTAFGVLDAGGAA
jgi:hypothetical protein